MIGSSEESPLTACARYLVSENRNSDLPVADRLKIQRKKMWGRILGRLYPLGWRGGLLFILISIAKRDTVRLYRNMVVADHASRVIHGALRRIWGADYQDEVKRNRASLTETYRQLFRCRGELKASYAAADVSHVTEFVRLIRLFHFYVIWKAWFRNHAPGAVLMARTNDQNRLALGIAAEEAGIPLAAFDIARVELKKPLPFAVDSAFCWTTSQADNHATIGIHPVRMPVPYLNNMKLPVPEANRGRCGLLLNAKCNIEALDAWLSALAEMQGIDDLLLRPHPGYDTERLKSLSHGSVCDWRQPLTDYLNGLDLAFALNTHAVVDALLHGVPVVYVGGLDPYAFDLHGFVRDGIACAYRGDMSIPADVNAFYSSEDFIARWNTAQFETDPEPERRALLALAGEDDS